MNWIERTALKIAWKRLETKMPKVRRYLPLIGVFVLSVTTLLKAFGLDDLAGILSGAGTVIGAQAPVGAVEASAAAAALIGACIKLYSELAKATK